MAGDWIKIETITPDKPEVVKIAEILGIDQDSVVGKLLRLWIWADLNSVDGNAISVTFAFLNRITFCEGFGEALEKVGWIDVESGNLSFPNFERHNGKSAKKRAETNRRVSKHRKNTQKTENQELPPKECNANVTQKALQKALPEKRREEYINTPPTPSIPDTTSRPVETVVSECVNPDFEKLQKQINMLRPKWAKPVRWSYAETQHLFNGGAAQMMELTRDDWRLLYRFLNSKPREGEGYWRPNNRSKFVETFSDVWASAYEWGERNAKKPKKAKVPEKPPERDLSEWEDDLRVYVKKTNATHSERQIFNDEELFSEFMRWNVKNSLKI